MKEITSSNARAIKNVCFALKRAINEFSKSKIFNKQPQLFSTYGEWLVASKLLNQGIKSILRKSNPLIDFELPEIHKKVEVKTSSLKRGGKFGYHYGANQKGKFDYLVLVGIDDSGGHWRERFFIFNKKEANYFYKGVYVTKPSYFIDIYTKELPPRKKLSKFVLEVNKNLKSYENRWDKILK